MFLQGKSQFAAWNWRKRRHNQKEKCRNTGMYVEIHTSPSRRPVTNQFATSLSNFYLNHLTLMPQEGITLRGELTGACHLPGLACRIALHECFQTEGCLWSNSTLQRWSVWSLSTSLSSAELTCYIADGQADEAGTEVSPKIIKIKM